MKRFLCLGMFTVFAISVINAQVNGDFQELVDPTGDTLSDWSGVPEGLHASFVTKDKRFAKHLPPQIQPKSSKQIKGWKGERVSVQLLLWTNKDVANVRVTQSEFENKSNGKKIEGEVYFERYVMTDEFACGCGKRNPKNFTSSLSPDMLDNLESYNMKGKSVRPVWISVDIPREANKGDYQADIKVEGETTSSKELSLQIEVLDHKLPKPKDWDFHLDLWQHPASPVRVNDVELWSDEHFKAMKPLMKRLADAGQKVITTTLNKDPWNVQTYDPYADMIIWSKDENDHWHYDYTIFDKWVKFMMDLGIDEMINAYSILPWNDEIHYKDASEDFVDVKAKPGTDKFVEYWKPFLKDFARHLKEKGWINKTNIALDERPPEQMDAAFELIKEVAPELGVSYADNHKIYQDYPGSEDISINVNDPFSEKDLKKRKEKGLNTTFYISCSSAFINTFTFSEPAASTYAGWYALANGFDGMLRWSYNSWTKKPLQDSRFRTWPAGDTYIVYPQNRSSIRFERLREGIQDYEKVHILRKQLKNNGQDQKLKKLNEAVDKLSESERRPDWNEDLNRAKEVLNSL